MIVMGSSLEVYPVAQLPAMVSKLVVVNLLPTPYDDRAEYVFHESTGEFSEKLTSVLGISYLEERYVCIAHVACKEGKLPSNANSGILFFNFPAGSPHP